jgi:hypothetical protein
LHLSVITDANPFSKGVTKVKKSFIFSSAFVALLAFALLFTTTTPVEAAPTNRSVGGAVVNKYSNANGQFIVIAGFDCVQNSGCVYGEYTIKVTGSTNFVGDFGNFNEILVRADYYTTAYYNFVNGQRVAVQINSFILD